MVAARTQVDRWRVVISVQAGQPASALPKPARLIEEPVRDGVPAVQFRVIMGGRPSTPERGNGLVSGLLVAEDALDYFGVLG